MKTENYKPTKEEEETRLYYEIMKEIKGLNMNKEDLYGEVHDFVIGYQQKLNESWKRRIAQIDKK